MPHTVKLDQFEGPLDLLLQLIEREELDVTAIALASVCEEYLAQLKKVERRSPEELADFLVVAAKLLYLKSLVLAPGASVDVEEDITGLTEQLRRYREFIAAAEIIAGRWTSGMVGYPTERAPLAAVAFLPPPRLAVAALRDVFKRILEELEPIVRIPHATIGRKISIEDRITEIRRLIDARPFAIFFELLRDRKNKEEAIVNFLAILELTKQCAIEAEQASQFAPIRIVRAAQKKYDEIAV